MSVDATTRRRIVKWIAIWGVWTLFAFFFASQLALQNQISRSPVSFWRILSWQMVSGYVWFALCPLLLYLATRFPLRQRGLGKALLVHLFAGLAVAFAQLAVIAVILPMLGYPPGREFAGFWDAYRFFVFINLHLSVLIYWGVVGVRSAFGYYQMYRERELKTVQLEARLAQSRLQVLKMQLHPHFLFNTLNAIAELIHRDKDAADRTVADLSDLLRMSFENLEVQEVPLRQELEFLEKYVNIERTRFADRLNVSIEVDPHVLDAKVPNMILQPLVENAIRHGIAPRGSGGKIEIRAASNNGHLEILVRDDGVGINDERKLNGVGLSNTRRRLNHLYGSRHEFHVRGSEGSGTEVDLQIPFSTY